MKKTYILLLLLICSIEMSAKTTYAIDNPIKKRITLQDTIRHLIKKDL